MSIMCKCVSPHIELGFVGSPNDYADQSSLRERQAIMLVFTAATSSEKPLCSRQHLHPPQANATVDCFNGRSRGP